MSDTTPAGRSRPRRPAFFGLDGEELHGGRTPGPAELTEAAHNSAAVVVGVGREAQDPAVTHRLVTLVDELGLDTVAELWANRPARSLPGSLWRLYVLREWVRHNPRTASREYTAGMRHTPVSHIVAGPAEPPGPTELQELADRILTGIFDGDLAVALERAAAFCRVISIGRAELANDTDLVDAERGRDETLQAASLLGTATDLEAAATAWRAGTLI